MDKYKWRSIRISYLIMFLTCVSYSIQMPSIWAYMLSINQSYSKKFMSWVVASYSLGQLVASPILSYVSGRTKNFRFVLIFCAILAVAGNLLYSILVDIDGYVGQTVALLAFRVILGISGANVAPLRLFIALSTTEEERISTTVTMSACQGFGYIIGPSLQAALVPLGYPGKINLPFLRVNTFTSCGQLNVIANAILLIILGLFFRDGFLKTKSPTTDSSLSSIEKENKSVDLKNLQVAFKNDYFCAIFMLVAYFICKMSSSVLETAVSPVTMDNFAWMKKKSTFINSIALCTIGLGAMFVFILLQVITTKIKESHIMVGGFVFILVSSIILIPMGTDKMVTYHENNRSVGCDVDAQPWCESVPALEYWQYGLSLVFFALGYSTTNAMTFLVFSRLIDRSAQGLWTGLLIGSGSLASVVGPIFIMKLYEEDGTQIAFGSWSAIIFLFLISTPFFMLRISKRDKIIKSQLLFNQPKSELEP